MENSLFGVVEVGFLIVIVIFLILLSSEGCCLWGFFVIYERLNG